MGVKKLVNFRALYRGALFRIDLVEVSVGFFVGIFKVTEFVDSRMSTKGHKGGYGGYKRFKTSHRLSFGRVKNSG